MARKQDPDHIGRVAQLQCCICAMRPVQVHHLLRVPERGAGRRADDCHTIPLCPRHHRALHNDGNEVRFLAEHGINGLALAAELYAAKSVDGMEIAVMGAWLMGNDDG